MKKAVTLVLTLLLLCGIAGCQEKTVVPETAEFEFALPDGYSITDIGPRRCSISDGESTVGGFVLTDFVFDSLEQLYRDASFQAYIERIGNHPEFISMLGEHVISVTLKSTNYETGEVSNEVHYFFFQEGLCYDLWLDTDLVEEEAQGRIVDSVGIQ